MNASEQLPETSHHKSELGRLTTRGRSIDDGSCTTLLVGLGARDDAAPLAADPSAQAAQDDDSQPAGYFIGECGHRMPPVGTAWYVGPCDDCGPSAT
ncbi:MAG: hypothetical protein ACRDRH_04885 [Pseudonocardia sp.]